MHSRSSLKVPANLLSGFKFLLDKTFVFKSIYSPLGFWSSKHHFWALICCFSLYIYKNSNKYCAILYWFFLSEIYYYQDRKIPNFALNFHEKQFNISSFFAQPSSRLNPNFNLNTKRYLMFPNFDNRRGRSGFFSYACNFVQFLADILKLKMSSSGMVKILDFLLCPTKIDAFVLLAVIEGRIGIEHLAIKYNSGLIAWHLYPYVK